MALGVLNDDEFEHTLINCELSPEDRLIVYTDGITETMNSADEMFGQDRFEALYNNNPKADIIDVIQTLDNYRGKEHQLDDISIVQVNCLSSPSPQNNTAKTIPPLPWKVEVELSPDDIRQTDPVAQVLDMVSAFQGMEKHRSTLFLLLAEMYNNSVDHGLLNLDSDVKNEDEGFFEFYMQRQTALENLSEGFLKLKVVHLPEANSIQLSITDSGKGFDAEKVKARLKDSDHHGRGLKLICELARKFDYQDQGRTIIVD